MKQKTKSSNILTTFILLILAVLCVTNVTYSYFTAQSKVEDSINFGDLNVRFVYQETSTSSPQSAEPSSIDLFSAEGAIQQNVPFELSLEKEGSPIYKLGINNQSGSCDAYVRFWIDAFVVDEGSTDTTNYGKYFFIDDEDLLKEGVITRGQSSVQNSSCYFFTKVLRHSSNRWIGTKLILQDVSETDIVPVDLLGHEIQITISLQAVQAANGAYLSVFGADDDTKGYYTGWGNT